MKLIRFGEMGKERPGMLLRDGSVIDCSIFGEDYDENFFGDRGLKRLRRWAATFATSAAKVRAPVRYGPPIARPSKIVLRRAQLSRSCKRNRRRDPQRAYRFLEGYFGRGRAVR